MNGDTLIAASRVEWLKIRAALIHRNQIIEQNGLLFQQNQKLDSLVASVDRQNKLLLQSMDGWRRESEALKQQAGIYEAQYIASERRARRRKRQRRYAVVGGILLVSFRDQIASAISNTIGL